MKGGTSFTIRQTKNYRSEETIKMREKKNKAPRIVHNFYNIPLKLCLISHGFNALFNDFLRNLEPNVIKKRSGWCTQNITYLEIERTVESSDILQSTGKN